MLNPAFPPCAIAFFRTESECPEPHDLTCGKATDRDAARRPVPHYGGLAPWQLRQIKAHIEKNLSEMIRIKDLARFAGLSDSYFYLAFRRSVGETPHGFIIKRRIARAQDLMLLTNLPLSQIASECGMTDQPHLTRLFRRQHHTSPALWRRTRRAAMAQAGSNSAHPP